MALSNYEDIVTNFESPTIVLAGPGTGKTYLLADRIMRLLDNETDKNTITVITFGTDANQYMINNLTDPNEDFKINFADLPHISTMHALGLKIVKEKPREVNLRKANLEVQGDEKVKKLMYRDAAFMLSFTEEDGKEALDCKQFGDCRENSDLNKCKICRKYWEIMSKCNCIDFDDQILFACKILENNPDILDKYQSQAKHLLVDEYQDINAAQFRLIELLSRESRNGLFVVGDDAQSIYGFRGSSPDFILSFTDHYPDAETATLTTSRRCHKKIVEDSFKVLEKYYEERSGRPEFEYIDEEGEAPAIWQLSSELVEAKMVARIARSSVHDKKIVLILVPKKEFFPLITKELSNYGVAYDCTESFLPRRIEKIKRLFDWIKNPNANFLTRLVVEDLINDGIAKVPGARKDRRCRPETIERRIGEETEIARLWESVDIRNNLFSVIRALDNPNVILVKIRDSLLNLINLYNDYVGDNRGEFLKQLSIITGMWMNPSQLEEDISSVVNLLQPQNPTSPGLVKLRTMRKAKGLQADAVIIVGLESDIMPDQRSDKVEEARLFYVSMTRAKKNLYMFHAYRRPRNISYGENLTDKRRSEFLDAIGRDSEFKRG
ncbi:MAG: ATP-dependent helicase [Candidatus Aminicenantes bacterium]|nr:MAG: ATP-dependent helicase [Candidatus Aminicenantes bacterium]